jgi:hypothetical protein
MKKNVRLQKAGGELKGEVHTGKITNVAVR